jgi:glycosyltransferase involved in cell wall biosynthesis
MYLHGMRTPELFPLTVVVPSYQRPDSALRAIRSLQEQEGELEILLVDNACNPELRDAVEQLNQGARLPVRWIPEPRIGLHNARHTGARNAQGNLIAFTDDDATFAPGWARAYITSFAAHPEMVAAGGPSLVEWDAPPPQWLHDWVERQHSCFQLSVRDLGPEFRLGPDEMFWGVNMAIRRDALFAAGGFNPDLFGERSIGDGEVGLYGRLLDAGALIGYVPDARVHHHVPPVRMTAEFLRRRMRNEGCVDVYSLLRHTKSAAAPYLGWLALRNGMAAGSAWVLAAPVRWSRNYYSLWIQLHAERFSGRVVCACRALFDADFRHELLRDDGLTV